jgi:hypothetical protein
LRKHITGNTDCFDVCIINIHCFVSKSYLIVLSSNWLRGVSCFNGNLKIAIRFVSFYWYCFCIPLLPKYVDMKKWQRKISLPNKISNLTRHYWFRRE